MVSALDFESGNPSSSLVGFAESGCTESKCQEMSICSEFSAVFRIHMGALCYLWRGFVNLAEHFLWCQGNKKLVWNSLWLKATGCMWFYGVMVSTLDFESSDPSSNLGRTCLSVLIWKSHLIQNEQIHVQISACYVFVNTSRIIIFFCCKRAWSGTALKKYCPRWGSNSRPSDGSSCDYETDALPTALQRQVMQM